MLIAIDGYEANVANRVGIGEYAFQVLVHLYTAISTMPENVRHEVIVYLPNAPHMHMPKETAWWRYRIASPCRLWTFIGFPWALHNTVPAPEVIFSPTHYVPRFTKIPIVMAIMDISYLKYPELFRAKDLQKLIHWTAYAAKKAAKIMTISDFSKNAIIKAYQVPSADVVVAYPGLTMAKTKIEKTVRSSISKRYDISTHYILSVGTLQPRKNYVRLIQAFAEFLKQNKQKFGHIDLVIAGKPGWLYEEILGAPEKYGVADRVKFIQFVPDEDLPELYRQSLCFALPSLYEGFGLPVLEAMASGCQVVVSNTSSLPEIAGKAGVYIDPEDVSSIVKGLLTAVRQRNLLQGKYRIRNGLDRVKLFSWEKAAEQTLHVLEEIGKK